MMDEGVRTTDDRAGASLNSFSFQSSILSFLRLQVILEQWGSLTAYFSLSRSFFWQKPLWACPNRISLPGLSLLSARLTIKKIAPVILLPC